MWETLVLKVGIIDMNGDEDVLEPGTGMTAAHTVLTSLRGSLDVSGFGYKSLL